MPLGALLGGWLGDAFGVRAALAAGTAGLVTSALFLIVSPVRQVRELADLTAARAPGPPLSLTPEQNQADA